MGDHISTSPFSPPYHESNSRPANNLPMLYYGLVVVGTAAIVLAIYNVIIIRWCAHERPPRGGLVGLRPSPLRPSGLHSCDTAVLSSFKYKKGGGGVDVEQGGEEYECPVCLSVFEEGEEVRQLPRCHHSFHAPCIDMWLYSHSDCPLCRTPASARPSCRPDRAPVDTESENSREGLLGSGMPGSQVPDM